MDRICEFPPVIGGDQGIVRAKHDEGRGTDRGSLETVAAVSGD